MHDDIDRRTLAGYLNRWPGEGPVWCPVASMRAVRQVGENGQQSRRGTQHFAPGARLYVRRVVGFRNSHNDEQDVEVIGRHRATHRYVKMIVRASWLEHWRPDLIYSPQVIRLLWPMWDGTAESKAEADDFVAIFATASTDVQ